MSNVLVVDFNRTIFEPDIGSLTWGAQKFLSTARKRGYLLVLLAQAKGSRRELIADLGLEPYFTEIILTNQKNEKQFKDIAIRLDADLSHSFVIGDRALKEILLACNAGWRTIWLKRGKFSEEVPDLKSNPEFTVSRLTHALNYI